MNESSRNSSTSKLRPYESSRNTVMASSLHKRSGTALIGSAIKITESVNMSTKPKKGFKKETQKLKISKDILKRLKRRSINYNSDKFTVFTSDKSRMSNLDLNQWYGENTNNLASSTFKKSKGIYKEIPLPISSTCKKLKKVIKESKQY